MSDALKYGFDGSVMYLLAPERFCGIKRANLNEELFIMTRSVTELILDLSRCVYLDSTLMGQLISLRKELFPVTIIIANPSPEAQQILTIMGLHKLFTLAERQIPEKLTLFDLESPEEISSERMLQAHELLSHLSPENTRRFETVIKTLRESLDKN